MLQTAVNGSEHILRCQLDANGTRLEKTEWLPTQDLRESQQKRFSSDGRHVRYMLAQIMDFLSHENGSDIWKVIFDVNNGKLPSFELATDVEVLPIGLQ